MCVAVQLKLPGKRQHVRFTQKDAQLSAYAEQELVNFAWGKRAYEASQLPLGGWARVDLLERGDWEKWFPKQVFIPAQSFCQHDLTGRAHWFKLMPEDHLTGIIARDGDEQRLYIAIILTERQDNLFLAWPKIVKRL